MECVDLFRIGAKPVARGLGKLQKKILNSLKSIGPSPESVDDFMMYTRAEGVESDFCNWS